MKIFNSIKWRLQIWYGLILVAVLVGFGVTAYQLERNRQFSRIDNQLHQRFGMLANAMRRPPPRSQFQDDGPPGQNPGQPLEFHLPPEAANLFDANDLNNFYFIIRSRDGKEIASSTNQPPGEFSKIENFFLKKVGDVSELPENYTRPLPVAYSFGNYRNSIETLPPGETILVGCSIAPELHELRMTALKLTGVGSIILLFGLAGGWWISSRAINPISDISSTATKISAGDLSQRINVAEAESELGQLASVLNSTFARLESAFAQQKQFASDAAHELRTPVSVILTQMQTALHREREAKDYKETLEACQRAAQRMRRLISSLLELARLDAGQTKLKREQFDFAKTIEDCIEQIKPIADENSINITARLAALEIVGDDVRLAQVATNLLTNAIKYNKPGGDVRVKLESQNGLAVLTVADTGNGIAAIDLPHVFQRFYRGDKSRTGANSSGLGLAICKAIVEAHSGTIEVSSTENVGTVFTVRLPVG